MTKHKKVQETKGGSAFIRFQVEIEEICCEGKFIGEEQEFEVVAASHWLQAIVSASLLGHGVIFLPKNKR